MADKKPILCLDFDGVLHSYVSGWQGADVISDGPVAGAQEFCRAALEHFEIVIHSSRCHQEGGVEAIEQWLQKYEFPKGIVVAYCKPSAFVTLDDRAITFTGLWPDVQSLMDFKPWPKIVIVNAINSDALKDLYEVCLSAKGTYEVLKLIGIDKELPGYERCVVDLEKALRKARMR